MTTTAQPARPPVRPVGAATPGGGARRHLPVLAAAGTLGAVTLLWAHGGGLDSLGLGGPAAVTSLGRLSGLVAADLLLIQVLLMARVPWVERAYGQDRLARWHRVAGFTSITLMLLHILLVTIGYAGSDASPVLGEAWRLVTTYPGMLLATAGSAALVMVAVTSVRAARAKLRYESWHLLHLYAYLGVGLSLPHQFWTGTDFAQPGARLFWWTLYVVTLGSVLVFRVGVPLWRSARHRLRVTAVVPEAPGITSVYLRGRHLDRLPVRAGHFFLWRFLGRKGWTRAQPYSLSAAPRADTLRITVKDLGDGSGSVAGLRPGTRVLIEGPYGRLTGEVRRCRRLTMIASGIGITPMRALMEAEHYRQGDATLIYRAGRPDEFAFGREIDWLAHNRGVRVVYLPGRRGPDGSWLPAGRHHDPVGALLRMAPHVARSDVYVCGPQPWMDSVVATLRTAAVPEEQIHVERFGW